MKLKSYTNKDRYGNMTSFEFYEGASVDMGDVPPMMQGIPDHPGDPKGTDTVPAWLTPGEFVMNAEATRMFEPQIEQMNNAGRAVQAQQGGTIPEYAAHGGQVGKPTGNYTQAGRPIFITEDGEYVSEKGVSIPISDMPIGLGSIYNIPSIQDGVLRNEDFLTEAIRSGRLNPTGVYDTFEEATKASKARSNLLRPTEYANGGPVYAAAGGNSGFLASILKRLEGVKSEAYLDSAGKPTIGAGSTRGVQMGDTASDDQVDSMLAEDIAVVDQDYGQLVSADLNTNQEAAVKSLLFNIGGPQFANSKARAALNAGDFETFKKEAAEFRKVGDKVIPGLENRRAQELALFDSPVGQDPWGISRRQVSVVPPSNTSRASRVNALNQASQEIKEDVVTPPVKIGNLLGNTVFQDDMGEFINSPNGPVYLDDNELQAMTRDKLPVDPGLLAAVEAQKTQVPPMDGAPPKSKFDTDGDGVLSKEELLAARNQMIPSKDDVKGSASTPFNLMPSGNQIPIDSPESLIARQEQILNDMVAANAPPAEIYAQKQKIDRINNIAPRQEAFSDVVEAQGKIEPINNQIEDLETQIERLEAAGLYDRANALRSEVASLNAQKPQLEKDLTTATKAQDDLYRDATLPDGKIVPDVGKVTADQLEGVDTTDQTEALDPAVPTIEDVPPKEFDEDEIILPKDTPVDDSDSVEVAKAIIEDNKNLPDDKTTDGQTPEATIAAGKNAPPEEVGKVESFLSDVFGDLFDKGELKRMAIMYLGSRLMGGSHNGSMNFAAKQYINRVDAKAAEKKALAKEERLDKKALAKERRQNVFTLIKEGKKTKDSIAAYEKSGDPRDLVDKPVLTKPPINTGETKIFYDKGGRGKVTALKMKDDNGNFFYVNSQGKQLNPFAFHEDESLVPGTQKYIDRELKIGKQMGDALEDLIKRDTITVDKKEIKPVGFASGSQGIEVARWMNKNKIPVNYMGSILESAYAAAAAEQKTTGDKVTNITSYLDKAFIDRIPGNEGIFTREDGKRVDSGTVMNLIGQGVSILRSKPGQESKSDEQLQNDMLAEMRREWFALDDKIRGEYNTKGTNEGETGFMVFMQQQIAEDVTQS